MDNPPAPSLQEYVIGELDRILAELRMPFTAGLIPTSLTQHLRDVVAAWPNVTHFGRPLYPDASVLYGTCPLP